MNPSSTNGPSRSSVALAFGIAIAAAVALIVVAVVSRADSSTPPATPNPVVALRGIPQQGAMLGSPSAKVTLIEYADPQCPACRLYTEEFFPTFVDDYVRPGKVKTEFRGFPFIGDDSVKAYGFLLAAAQQDKLWNLAEALYRNQGRENSAWVTDDLVRRIAGQIAGLDVDKLFADAGSERITQEADGAAAAASAVGITGTPTFLVAIGSEQPYLVQFSSLDQMRAALADALAG